MADSDPSNQPENRFSIRSGIAANILANVLIAVIFFVSVPLFIRYLGVEGYGLVGFFIFAQSLVTVLDLGLMTMLTREFAVMAGDKNSDSGNSRDLLRTSEVIYWFAAVIAGLIWTASAGFLTWFVNPEGIDSTTLYQCFLLMGATFALQFPVSLYTGVLFGLRRQVAISAVSVTLAVFRNLGAPVVLHFYSSTPQTFFAWQLIAALLHVPLLAWLVRSALPRFSGSPRFRTAMLTEKWRLVAGIGLITLALTILANQDKFIVARLISLSDFGYYALAAVVANGLHWLVQPIFKAMLPRLSQLAASSDRGSLSLLYHQGCQLLTIVVVPVAALWAIFPNELMLLWQRNGTIADNTDVLVTILMTAAILNAIFYMPYALQLAHGSTRLHLAATLGGAFLSIPLTILAAVNYGAVGAAAVSVGINLTMILFVVPAMHQRLLRDEAVAWCLDDVLIPAGAAVLVGAVGRYVFYPTSATATVIQLALILAAMYVAAVAASSEARRWIGRRLKDK